MIIHKLFKSKVCFCSFFIAGDGVCILLICYLKSYDVLSVGLEKSPGLGLCFYKKLAYVSGYKQEIHNSTMTIIIILLLHQ